MNKIISFGLWGDDPKYINGALENIRLQKIHYPDFKCRFYVDHTKKDVISKLQGEETIPMTFGDRTERFWRMLVTLDGDVDLFIIRDCDSRLGEREAVAVKEFEQSNKTVHIMRDHKRHTAPIMGGMWGGKRGFLPHSLMADIFGSYTDAIRKGWTPLKRIGKYILGDQWFLAKNIYPLIKDNALVHSRPKRSVTDLNFTIRLKNPMEFVGQIYNKNNMPTVKP